MIEALSILTSIAVVLLAGLIVAVISKRSRVSNMLLLIILGIGLKQLSYQGAPVFEFSPTFLIAISVLALVMVTFDGTSRFKLKEVDKISWDSAKLVFWFIPISIVLLGTATILLFLGGFTFKNIIFGLIFAFIMAGTDPAATFYMMKDKTKKFLEVLELESIINTPIIVLVPFILLDLFKSSGGIAIYESFLDQVVPFLRQIVVGIGAGVIVGIIVFKAMKKAYHHDLSPLAIITAALLSYILAENLGGNGVLSVATMGLFFGNIYVKKKVALQEFSSILSNSLEIFVFVLLGFIISIDFSTVFLLKSIVLFIILLVARWTAINIALNNSKYNLKQKIFMTLNMPKGIAVATVVLSLTTREIVGFEPIVDLILIFMIYSLVISSVLSIYSKKFVKVDLEG